MPSPTDIQTSQAYVTQPLLISEQVESLYAVIVIQLFIFIGVPTHDEWEDWPLFASSDKQISFVLSSENSIVFDISIHDESL